MADNGEAVPRVRPLSRSTSYIPYGEVFVEESAASWQSPYYFNAKELDNETGLYYYGARYLDPTGAMWLSVDPVFHPGSSPYAYCLNNPVKLIDPDGMWEEDSDKNLVAQKGDNAWTLAKYLNTSPYVATEMLKDQGYKTDEKGILNLKVGDKFTVEHQSPKNENRKDLGFLGNQIRKRAHSEYSQNAFENYWDGKGDVEMTSERFAGILLYIKNNHPIISKGYICVLKSPTGNTMNGNSNVVSFYSSYEYDYYFGRAIVYTNSKGAIVGFYDFYDFDKKDFGVRSFSAEIKTRLVNWASPKTAKPFSVRYGFSSR